MLRWRFQDLFDKRVSRAASLDRAHEGNPIPLLLTVVCLMRFAKTATGEVGGKIEYPRDRAKT